MGFSDRLKKALAAADKTQRDVAKHLSVAESTVSQWVSGKRLPDLLTADRLAAYLGVSVDELLGHNDDPKGAARAADPPPADQGDELVVVFRGKRQKLSPEYQRLLIKMMEAEAEAQESAKVTEEPTVIASWPNDPKK